MKIEQKYELKSILKSSWHRAPAGRFRFTIEGQTRMQTEWEGTPPPLAAKSFWRKYARRRDVFLMNALPEGMKIIVACCWTQTIKTIEGKGAGK